MKKKPINLSDIESSGNDADNEEDSKDKSFNSDLSSGIVSSNNDNEENKDTHNVSTISQTSDYKVMKAIKEAFKPETCTVDVHSTNKDDDIKIEENSAHSISVEQFEKEGSDLKRSDSSESCAPPNKKMKSFANFFQ